MRDVPLFVRFTLPPIAGHGFVAGVRVDGRAVACEEDGEWWVDGVDFGQVAAGGPSLREAADALRDRIIGVLFDLTDEATDWASFERRASEFLHHVDEVDEARWTAARAAAQPKADELSAKLGIRRDQRETGDGTLVVRLQPTPSAALPNQMDEVTLAGMAA